MIADARKSGFKIVANCPYVRAQIEKHPDWRDVAPLD
jgi:predicted GNAT family acetyltransferase